MMKEDAENRTRWKHKREWHNRGNVWDKIATCWAGEKDWMIARKEQNSPEDNYNFIIYILNEMMLSTEHRKTEKKDEEKRLKRKARRDVGPEDTTVQPREGGPTVHNNWEMPKKFCTHGGRMELPPRSRTSTTS